MTHALVTGGAGFIGSHLTESLLARGYRVTVVDNESTGSFDNLAAVRECGRLVCRRGSASDPALVESLLDDVDEVYHLAASVGVQLVANQPIYTIENNILPAACLLKALLHRHQSGRAVKFVLASSSEVYGKNPKLQWTEDEDLVLGPTDRSRWSYGAAKAIDEFLTLAYFREHGLPVVVGRFFNVVGPRQTGAYGMVLPRMVEAALAGGPILVHDDGLQTRCFAHVQDVVEAVLALMQTESAVGRVFNIGSDQPIAIVDLARRVAEIACPAAKIAFQSYAEAYSADFEDCRRRVPDLSRLRAAIDFRPRFDLDAIIGEVVAWKQNIKKEPT